MSGKLLLSGKMTQKGQLTIPSPLREHLHLEEGDRLEFELQDDGSICVKPFKKTSLRDVVGILESPVRYDPQRHREQAHRENAAAKLGEAGSPADE